MKNVDWDTLVPEMKEWNGGKGIDPESWVGCEGNFRLASAYTLVFWPQFTEYDGMIFGGEVDAEAISGWMKSCGGNRQSVEATLNHIHLLDLHYRGCPDASVERLAFLGNVLKDIYRVKLAAEFPGREIIVDFHEPLDRNLGDYQLTFYQPHDS
jgi:hypothetical protein